MECCQRTIYNEVIPETCLSLSIALIIDSSCTMGSYSPQNLESAVNSFFGSIGSTKDADDLIEICVYESHDEDELLAGFGRASTYSIKDLRYGGSWNLPSTVARATEDLTEYVNLLETKFGLVCSSPLIVIISDNPVIADHPSFYYLEKVINSLSGTSQKAPRFILVTNSMDSDLAQYVPNLKIKQATKDLLESRLREIADLAKNDVLPKQLPSITARSVPQNRYESRA